MDKRKKWTKEESDFLVYYYTLLQKKDLIKALYPKSWFAIKSRASVLGVAKKKASRHSINHDYFSHVTEESSYWAGFIAADGCLKNGYLRVLLSKADSGHLYKLKESLHFSGDIKHGGSEDGKGRYHLNSYLKCKSEKIVADLNEFFGVSESKSVYLLPKTLPNERLSKAFITGLIDGDGCIGYSKKEKGYITITFTGTEELLIWVRDFIMTQYRFRNLGKVIRDNNVYRFRIAGSRAMRVIEDLTKLNLPKLERKWNKINGNNTKSFVETARGRGEPAGNYKKVRKGEAQNTGTPQLGA